MYTKQIVLLALAAVFPAINAQNGVTCQTSSGSPTTGDVTDVINQLNGIGGTCAQTNDKDSDCSTILEHGSAAISICGGTEYDISCADVANYADQIQQDCLSIGLAGGTYTVSPSIRVEVIHSS